MTSVPHIQVPPPSIKGYGFGFFSTGNFRVFYQLHVLGWLSVSSYGDEHLFLGIFVQRKYGISIFHPDTNLQRAYCQWHQDFAEDGGSYAQGSCH